MSIKRLLIGAVALVLLLAACADNDGTGEDLGAGTSAGAAAQPAADLAGPATIDVKVGQTALGDILVGPDGLSLYAFTNDIDAISACYGTCADAWPPVIVDVDWTAGPGLDFGIFATTVREDGQLQLVAGQWPLYYFAGDGAPGDLNGQGSGQVWFAVGTDGVLITEPAPADATTDAAAAAAGQDPAGGGDAADEAPAADDAPADEDAPAEDASSDAPAEVVSVATTELGQTLIDVDGLTLYGFLDDDEGTSNCNDACADAWPPLLVDGDGVPAGLDPSVYSVIERADGSFQLAIGRWPLYRFAGDAAPGDVNGQGSGDVWFAAAPDGSLIRPSGATEGTNSDGGSDSGSRDY